MKYLVLLIALSGCASVNKDLTNKFSSKSGYFKINPNPDSSNYNEYSPCGLVKIKEIVNFGEDYIVKFEQSGKLFSYQTKNVDDLDANLLSELPKYQKSTVCEKRFYEGMSLAHFMAIYGKPDAISISAHGADQYIYRNINDTRNYYYFRDNKLTNWQILKQQ